MKRAIIFAVALTGCAGQQAINEVTAACTGSDKILSADCVSKHPQFGNLPKNAQRQVTHRLMLSEQVKSHQITEAQAQFLQQEYEGKIINQDRAISEAQSQSASNAMMMTGAALMAADAANRQPVIYPAPQKMYPTTTTCMGGYRSVTCNNF